ncbi:MAG: AAA-like domain-containing protein, partial [Bernardetiaceae bacterium]
MKKRFNITGTCRADEHYMMDDRRRFTSIMEMVEYGEYFVINRPRQYGKTTMLFALMRELDKREDYLPILMSFQGVSESFYQSSDTFARFFFKELKAELQQAQGGFSDAQMQTIADIETLDGLSERITTIVKMTDKKLVLLIDEVDASSNYEPFLYLLGMLRTKYLQRDRPRNRTFHSIVLAGVHDIKSLKFKMRNPEEAQYNSPWNIAADFKVVM